jgi:hypothetical protein
MHMELEHIKPGGVSWGKKTHHVADFSIFPGAVGFSTS